MKKIAVLLIILILVTGCNTKTNNFHGDVKLSNESVDLGLWVAQDIAEIESSTNEVLSSDKFSISFWIKPVTNKTGTILFSFGDEMNNVICTTSGSTSVDGVLNYSGITLQSTINGTNYSLAAEGTSTLQTGKFNQVVINYETEIATVYLNGENVVSGKLKIKTNNEFNFGKSLTNTNNSEGWISDLILSSTTKGETEINKQYLEKTGDILLDSITFANMDDIQNAPWLVDIIIDEIPVVWTSSNPEVMSIYGKLQTVEKDTEVVMSAKVDFNNVKSTKDFTFTIRALSPERKLIRDMIEVDASLQKVVHDGFALPISFTNESIVSWEIEQGGAVLEDNKIVKNSANEKENIKIKVILNNKNQVLEKTYHLVLLDKVEGYILSYFNGELGEETGKLAYSNDALHWKDLNDGQSIIESDLGNGRIRDPYITRDKNGNFVILATEGFDNPSIYIIQSTDLLDLSNQQHLQVAYYDEAIQMSGTRAWAPEMTYDMETDQYYIYYSDPGIDDLVGHIYCVTSFDLTDVSYPYSFYNPGYNVIDGTMIQLDGKYWLLYKDERKAAQTIFFASTDKIQNGFGLAYDDRFIFEQKYIEGPFSVKAGDKNYLYVDYYPKGKFYVAEFDTLGKESKFTLLEETQYQLPNEDVRHGSIIPVTNSELDKIINFYNKK